MSVALNRSYQEVVDDIILAARKMKTALESGSADVDASSYHAHESGAAATAQLVGLQYLREATMLYQLYGPQPPPPTNPFRPSSLRVYTPAPAQGQDSVSVREIPMDGANTPDEMADRIAAAITNIVSEGASQTPPPSEDAGAPPPETPPSDG